MNSISDLTTRKLFGVQWVLVFYHSAENNLYFNDNEIMNFKGINKYSILGLLSYDYRIRGKFEFFLEYSPTEYNWWRQTKNPWDEPFKKCTQTRGDISSCPVDGFECVDCQLNNSYWGGLGRTDPNSPSAYSYLDGSIGDSTWCFAIGSRQRWTSTSDIPGGCKNVKHVSLWMRGDKIIMNSKTCKTKKSFINHSLICYALLVNK